MSCYGCRSDYVASCRWCGGTVCSKHCVYVYDEDVPLTCCLNCVKSKELKAKENYFLEEI